MILRSTVAPGTTEFVAGYLEKHRGFTVGEDLFVAHVPERIAADRFMEEIGTLPCIVGGVGQSRASARRGCSSRSAPPIVQTTPVQAELAKIWTNILRYATFALPNLLMMDCERHGANVFDVIELINRDYPRGGMAQPGLTAGTCLRKDFTFSEERSSAPGMLLAVSRVHETVPLFLVDGVKRRIGGSLRERRVAVLGLSFKRDTDDERDSLSHKLIRLLERELADVAVHDPLVATPTASFEEAVSGAEVVVVATNHSAYSTPAALRAIADLAGGDCLIVDPWNALGTCPGVRLRRRGGGAARMSRRGWAAFAAMSLIWGMPYLFIKVAVDEGISPSFLSFARVVIAAAILLALAGAHDRHAARALEVGRGVRRWPRSRSRSRSSRRVSSASRRR